MNVRKIEKLEELLGLPKDHTIIGQNIKRLTAPGDNYGSLMLSVDIIVQTPNGTEEIHAVAKLLPPNEYLQGIFNIQVTYRNEVGFYKKIVPALRKFQRDHGVNNLIDFFPEYYGSRLNLKNDDTGKVDSDAVLLLENLKISNYVNLERKLGFDLNGAKLVLTNLAHLHAVPLALRLQKPAIFESEIKPYLAWFQFITDESESLTEKIRKLVESIDEIKPLWQRILEGYNQLRVRHEPRQPWATIAYNDCWVNNNMMMLKEGKPIRNKIVDYQVCDYGSPAKDVVFFLFSSVQISVLEKHYNELITFYHKTFISVLEELNCDTEQFSIESFSKELDFEAQKGQFGHIVFMLFGIFAPAGSIKELDELSPDDMGQNEPTDLHKQRMAYVVKEFVKRHWI